MMSWHHEDLQSTRSGRNESLRPPVVFPTLQDPQLICKLLFLDMCTYRGNMTYIFVLSLFILFAWLSTGLNSLTLLFKAPYIALHISSKDPMQPYIAFKKP